MHDMDLEAMEHIKRVKYLYSRSLDTCNREGLTRCFTEDARIDYRGGTYRFEMQGRDEIVDTLVASFHEEFLGSHTVHMPVIDVDGDTATGLWTLLDYALNFREDNKTTVGASHYRDTYVRGADGDWRISVSEYERVYERVWHEPEPHVTAHMLKDLHQKRSAAS